MKIKSIKPIKPEMSRCISVENSQKLFAIGESNQLLTHNSVAQQNIIFSCLLRPDKWVILGIDLKRVELSRFRSLGMDVATSLPLAVDFLRFAQSVMMKRYERMEEMGINNFLDLPVPGEALLVMIDEAGELLSPTGAKTDEAKAEDELKGEAKMIIGSIARLGRAAGVHLVVAAQRPDAELIPGETRTNLAVKVGCGRMEQSTSDMLFKSDVGMRTRANPPGGIYVQMYGNGNRAQGFYAPDGWLNKFYEENPHLKPDLDKKKGDFDDLPTENGEEEEVFNPIEDWDSEMDEIMEVTNDKYN